MTLAALHDALNREGVLFKAVCGACWRAAVDIQVENSGTSNHKNRLLWASRVKANRKAVAGEMLSKVLENATLAVDPYGAAMSLTDYDNAVQFVVNGLIDTFATGG